MCWVLRAMKGFRERDTIRSVLKTICQLSGGEQTEKEARADAARIGESPRRAAEGSGLGIRAAGMGRRVWKTASLRKQTGHACVMGIKGHEMLDVWKNSGFRVCNFPWVAQGILCL